MLISYSPLHNQNLTARKVKRVRMDVFATPEFSKRHPFTTPEELAQYPFVLLSSMTNYSYNNVLGFIHVETAEIKTVTVSGKLRFDNIYTAINCCRNGMGYLLTSQLLLKNTMGIISTLPSEWEGFIDCYIIYRNRKNLPLCVQRLLDYIIELMTEGWRPNK